MININKEILKNLILNHKKQMAEHGIKNFIYIDFLGYKYATTKDGKLFNMFFSKNKVKQISLTKSRNGYYGFRAHHNRKVIRILQHRLVAFANGKIKDFFDTKKQVHHKNGNKLDNRNANLEVVTAKEHAAKTLKKRIANKENLLKEFEKFFTINRNNKGE